MKKRAKKAKALKRARPATRGPARSEVSGIAKPAAELFVKSVLARGEAAKAVKGKLPPGVTHRSEEHTSELQSQSNLVCRLLLEKKKKTQKQDITNMILRPPLT